MDKKTLIKKINEIQWEEQMDFWLSEKYPDSIQEDQQRLENMLIDLGNQLTSKILDKLEQEGEVEWALRLSLYVRSDDSKNRGERYINDSRYLVKTWARILLQQHS